MQVVQRVNKTTEQTFENVVFSRSEVDRLKDTIFKNSETFVARLANKKTVEFVTSQVLPEIEQHRSTSMVRWKIIGNVLAELSIDIDDDAASLNAIHEANNA